MKETPDKEEFQNNVHQGTDDELLYEPQEERETKIESDTSEEKDSQKSQKQQKLDSNYSEAWKCWFRMFGTPLAGLRAMGAAKISAATIESAVLYPLIALAAIGAFAKLFYFSDSTITSCLVNATCVFVTFFATYFLIFPLSRLLMSTQNANKVDSTIGHRYIGGLLATLALFYFFYETLPALEILFAFTPAYTIYISYKGVAIFNFPESKRTINWVILAVLIVGLPFLVYEILEMLMPADITVGQVAE